VVTILTTESDARTISWEFHDNDKTYSNVIKLVLYSVLSNLILPANAVARRIIRRNITQHAERNAHDGDGSIPGRST